MLLPGFEQGNMWVLWVPLGFMANKCDIRVQRPEISRKNMFLHEATIKNSSSKTLGIA